MSEEVQTVEGQDPTATQTVPEPAAPPAEKDISQMTVQEIDAKIDADADFAAKVASGELKIPDFGQQPPAQPPAQPEQPPAQPDNVDPSQQPVPAQTPAPAAGDTPTPPAQQPAAPAEPPKILKFEVPESDMEGYKTPGEAVKAKRHADKKIAFQETQISELSDTVAQKDQVIADLNKKLEAATKQKPPAQQSRKVPAQDPTQPAQAPAEGEDAEPDIYDPEYLKSIGRTAKEVQDLKKSMDAINNRMTESEKKNELKAAMSKEFKDIATFQGQHTDLQTKKPIEVINAEYKAFVRDVGRLAGTDGSQVQNMSAVQMFLHEDSPQAEQLRKLADDNGISLPDDFENYSKVINIRNTRYQYMRKNSQGQDEPITLEQAHQLLYGPSATRPTPPAPPAQPQPGAQPPAGPPAGNMEQALNERGQYAAQVPPGASGPDMSLDALDANQQAALLDTPAEVLRANPTKLKLVNEFYAKLGMPPLNPFGQRALGM